MDHPLTVLVTGAGAPGIAGTLWALKHNPDNRPITILTTDINPNAIGQHLSDKFATLPAPESEDYIPALSNLVTTHNIQVILPQTTREIQVLCHHHNHFNTLGAKIALSDHTAITKANNKLTLLNTSQELGLPTPKHIPIQSISDLKAAAKSFGYPDQKFVIKPPLSNGSRGVRIISPDTLTPNAFLNEKPQSMNCSLDTLINIFKNANPFPPLIAMEYLPGDEYTVDLYQDDRQLISIPRKRLTIRSGITFKSAIDLRDDIITHSKSLAKALNLRYCFGFQYKLNQNGDPLLLECNPRVQGTMIATVQAGLNIIYASVLSAIGSPTILDEKNLDPTTTFQRYWGGLSISDSSPPTHIT